MASKKITLKKSRPAAKLQKAKMSGAGRRPPTASPGVRSLSYKNKLRRKG